MDYARPEWKGNPGAVLGSSPRQRQLGAGLESVVLNRGVAHRRASVDNGPGRRLMKGAGHHCLAPHFSCDLMHLSAFHQ
jgi:hypothetical protein